MQQRLSGMPRSSSSSTPSSRSSCRSSVLRSRCGPRVVAAAAAPASSASRLPPSSSPAPVSVAAMSSQMRSVRSKMEEDEQLRVLMAGFRGSNLNEVRDLGGMRGLCAFITCC
jgi:aarF domain-containing kinase